jgi:hypothetical protein
VADRVYKLLHVAAGNSGCAEHLEIAREKNRLVDKMAGTAPKWELPEELRHVNLSVPV